nr:hypothetical protein [Escherichia coli]
MRHGPQTCQIPAHHREQQRCHHYRHEQARQKNTGLKRGMPIFKCRDLIEQHHIAVRSSNFTLYEDYSNRFHETLEGFAEDTDRYSVDESFMLLKKTWTK